MPTTPGSQRQNTSTRRDPSHWEGSNTQSRVGRRRNTTKKRETKVVDAVMLGRLLQSVESVSLLMRGLEQTKAEVEGQYRQARSLAWPASQASQLSTSTYSGSQAGLAHPFLALRGHPEALSREGTPYSVFNSARES